jgi:hypothetical protein
MALVEKSNLLGNFGNRHLSLSEEFFSAFDPAHVEILVRGPARLPV